MEEYAELLLNRTQQAAAYAAEKAMRARRHVYGDAVYIRGLIEISNICRNDCLYCGIRRTNRQCVRYRLTPEQILSCCREGYGLGFRTFVLQGGEDSAFPADAVCALVRSIKDEFPDCAVTLSLGEYPTEAYQAMFDAGADRYLLRHETADRAHYASLHPPEMSFDNRMRCLRDLKAIGFQVGCGFMVGSPDRADAGRGFEICRAVCTGNVRYRPVYPASRHAVWKRTGRQRGIDAVSALAPPADPAHAAAARDDRARHPPAGRPGAGDAGRRKCGHAKPVPARGAGEVQPV